MKSLTASLRAIGPAAALRVLLLFVLAAAGTTLWAQQRIASASVTINVLPGLTATLTADPQTIVSGGSATLTWSTTGASSATLDPGGETISMDDLASGTKTVSPTATTTYTLTVGDNDADTDDVTATVTVTVLAIDSFAADDRSPETGESVILSWRTSGSDRVELQQGASGNFNVISGASTSPDGSYTRTENTAVSRNFRLVAYAGTLSLASSTVGVTWRAPAPDPDPCVIDSFSASPSTIEAAKTSTLSWRTTDATSASINQSVGSIDTGSLASGSTNVTPNETTTYTLRCSGEDGTTPDTATAKVTVKPCAIDSFSASPSTITKGGSSTLSWTTTSVSSVSIPGTSGTLGVDDSASVTPTATTTYTLTATCTDGSTSPTDTAKVTVNPMISSFSASPSTVEAAEASTLSWTTMNTNTVSITNTSISDSSLVNSSTDVMPTTTTSYKLTASGDSGTTPDTETVSVTVKPCAIDSFTASSTSITEGDKITLNWTTTSVRSVSIPGTTGALLVDGSTSVTPTADTTYTLTATCTDGSTSPTKSVAIVVTRLPPTANLEADPTEFFGLTDPVTLYWSTTRATSAEIDNDVGSVTPVAAGSITVYPESTTTYTLTATGPGGSATSSVEVLNVDSQRTLTATLTADSTTITSGGSTMLRWTTEGADGASLSQDVGDDIGSVAATELAAGSRSVSPTATTKYMITATKGEGDDAVTATAAVTITVTQP